jgi:RNA polymerase sigma factor (sigma-70 family)
LNDVRKPVQGDEVSEAAREAGAVSDAARKRVAVEMLAKHERSLRRTARRYSICAADADDALQRAMEILLVKAPPGEARELVRWMQTVTKHEALAIRRGRERQMGAPAAWGGEEDEPGDWLALIPSQGAGPAERVERREAIARSREALKTLKPAELKALTLLAEGYSYAEIGEMTGFSRTKPLLPLFSALSSGLRSKIGRSVSSYPATACSLMTGSIQ